MDRRNALFLTGGAAALGLGAASSNAATPGVLQPIADVLTQADDVADSLGYTDAALRPAYHQHVLKLLALGYVEVFGTSIENPDWVPHIPFYMAWGSPNPDDTYRFAPVDATGSYRLSGQRGTSAVATVTLRKGGAHLGRINGKTLYEIDLNEVTTDRHGRYDILLSPSRPTGYSGTWVAMHPETQSLLFRTRTTNGSQRDPSCAIERLGAPRLSSLPSAEQFAHRMTMLRDYVAAQNSFLLGYLNKIRDRGAADGFIFDDQSSYGGLVRQKYLMHVFTLADDEALVIETELPSKVHYWSVQVFDAFFGGIENVYQRSAANHEAFSIDRDGRVRIVVAAEDPGVANWLTTGGWPRGGMMWRWNDANIYPQPTVRKLKIAQLRAALPADTPQFDAAQRQAQLRKHAEYYRTRAR